MVVRNPRWITRRHSFVWRRARQGGALWLLALAVVSVWGCRCFFTQYAHAAPFGLTCPTTRARTPAFLTEAVQATPNQRVATVCRRSEASVAMVVAANGAYVRKALAFLEQARTVGGWDGDIIAMHDGSLSALQKFEMKRLRVTLHKAETYIALSSRSNLRFWKQLSFHWAKLDLFTRGLFRSYQRLLYIDVDHVFVRPFESCPTDALDEVEALRAAPAHGEAAPPPSGAVLAPSEGWMAYEANFAGSTNPVAAGALPVRFGGLGATTRVLLVDVDQLRSPQAYWDATVALGTRFGPLRWSAFGEQGFLLALLSNELVSAHLPFAPDSAADNPFPAAQRFFSEERLAQQQERDRQERLGEGQRWSLSESSTGPMSDYRRSPSEPDPARQVLSHQFASKRKGDVLVADFAAQQKEAEELAQGMERAHGQRLRHVYEESALRADIM